ncbi:sulfite exporter TauE/SafE family protein [Aridibaculum aurantiacum]|uniref:sulfite exporter TauE/SafE family protein n=1 Tax=Aridibaculum aurantiacum TaxID=2810307 RepID=UPI001A962FFD|nr:sulfite exporter TauE/SafE family protein [Aridibaculum aurantiacum]
MSVTVIISAFALGLVSSFHCVGMCGAIAFSLPTQHLNGAKKAAGILLYNAGRITTYSIIGVLFGLLGRQIHIAGFQQWFSIIAGITILIIVIQGAAGKPLFHLPGYGKVQLFVQSLVSIFLTSPSVASMYLLGMANGLLPCGLVYMAVTGALATGSIGGAAGFMASFGAGTFPALFLLSYFGYIINLSTRNTIKRMVPYVVATMAVLLILRGLNLNIPYLSPLLASETNNISCH